MFRREPYQEPALTGREAFNRAILIVAGMVLGAALLPELPRRPFFRPKPPMNFWVAFGVVVLVGSHFIYTVAWRPWRDGPPGYRLVGEFEVREKDHLFSKCWVRLAPGDNYQLEVEPKLHEQLRVGSRLRLVYTAQGRLVSLIQLQ
ncbi:hypothetical protein [Hymenobacter cheonanensis]|uniref:hypothetical protein n=1 Tax=Hymenobacter sp. CA2-7 TaxID=3063993 RepID=UPI0027128E29|nr:hypothetical protein [Hymenobacter sp. CA2-7]MDO7887643.1 hypothetical protein [Hymenobacter sp. CA2-7]